MRTSLHNISINELPMTPPNDRKDIARLLERSHLSPAHDVVAALGVDTNRGLSDDEVSRMRERFGANTLPEPKPKSKLRLFLEQFNNPLIFILFGAAVLTSIVADPAEAVTIFFVVIFNAIIGYVQEQRASERLQAVKSLTAPVARVVRGGEQHSINASELVVGDVVLLESGVKVPADIRLVELYELTIDESPLTGESLPVEKTIPPVVGENIVLGDRTNVAFAGTTVRKGRGKGVTVGVGASSEIGKITRDIAEAEEISSPLQDRLKKFGTVMAIAIGVVIAVIFGVGLLRDYDPTTMLLTAIGLAVSAIPEGLPIAVTVALSIGVYQMARRDAIVRKMNAVETLGSTTVICSDKTGTLTRNQMTTIAVATDDRVYRFTGVGYDPVGELQDDLGNTCSAIDSEPLLWTLRVGLLCSESSFVQGENGRELLGDPTEGAIIVAAEKARLDVEAWRSRIVLPFESERMYMVSRIHDGERSYYAIKGSLEKILEICDRELRDEGIMPIDKEWIIERQTQFSEHGLRVIAAAFIPLERDTASEDELSDGIFAGLFGIEDPPREEVKGAIAEAHRAGINVVMITGDHIATANSIAKQLDITFRGKVRAISGAELTAMDDDTLYERVNTTTVYARVAPEHKLRIVRQLQHHGHVVAMTGDGVNDAPALKQADIGIAMGSGTDVAKEAGALIVRDDNFTTIVSAIRYGRVMFRNLQHMVLYVLCTSFGGVLTLTAAVIFGFPLPMIAVQLLWINLVTDGTSTIPLAYEKEHGNIMADPPRKRGEGLLNWQMAERIIGSGLIMMFGTLMVFEIVLAHYGLTALSPNIPEDVLIHARTAAFTTLALFQIWNVHNSRALEHSLFQIGIFRNKPLVAVTLLALALQVAAVELPFMHPLLKTTNLTTKEWLLCLGVSFALVILVELRKLAGRSFVAAKARHEAAIKPRVR